MVSGTSVKITNVSQVRHENQDCLATAVKNPHGLCGSREPAVLPPNGGLPACAGGRSGTEEASEARMRSEEKLQLSATREPHE